MKRQHSSWLVVAAVCLVVAGRTPVQAQEQPTTKTAQPAPTTEPASADQAEQATALTAKAIEVVGDVRTAPSGTSPLKADAWKPVREGDELGVGTSIRTGLRSYLTLLFGDNTVVQVKRFTLASISDFYETATQETIRLGLGYGAVRGGATEGLLRSDLIIDSTVATLAKRGTEGFEMEVEPHTGRFRISLAEEGLVEALQRHTNQHRLVHPGEYATELNIAKMWVRQAMFDRTVHLVANESMTQADLDFTVDHARGLGAVDPGAGAGLTGIARPGVQSSAAAGAIAPSARWASVMPRGPDLVVVDRRPVRRPEGNFGVADTLRVLVPQEKRSRRTAGSATFRAWRRMAR